MQEQKMK